MGRSTDAVLETPLTLGEFRERLAEDGSLSGVVPFDLDELVGIDLDAFLDVLGERLFGSPLLEGPEYEVVGVVGPVGARRVTVRVTGGVSSTAIDHYECDDDCAAHAADCDGFCDHFGHRNACLTTRSEQ